jgi:DNA-binding HxlR family transcriptional regulator
MEPEAGTPRGWSAEELADGVPVQRNVLSQRHPARYLLERISGKWFSLIVYALGDGPRRHSELLLMIEGISQKVLTQTLRAIERDGLVTRRVMKETPRHVEYELTALGRSLAQLQRELCHWAIEHVPEIERANADHERASGET